jgi:hypothetical protein
MAEERDRDSWDSRWNAGVITTEIIAAGKSPVLLVIHEAGHGGWQFHDGSDVRGQRIVAIAKEDVLKMDPTLINVTDLPVGWQARRRNRADVWVRSRRDSRD